MNIYEHIYDSLGRQDYLAAAAYIRELEKYDRVEAARLLVSLYIEQGNSQMAMDAWQKLYAILPRDFFTAFLHARILFMQGRYVSAYEELMGIVVPQEKQRDYGEKIFNLLGQCCRILGKTTEAALAYKKAAELAVGQSLQALEYSNYLFNLHYSGEHSAEFLRQAAAGFQTVFGNIQPLLYRTRKKDCRLRIGYLSSDFRRHVMLCFSYALLTAYNREKFAVYAYMLAAEDAYSQHLRSQVTVWRNLRGLLPKEAAQVICGDQLDILVDLAGHTKGNGLPIMAYKPAPVQVSGIGYFASTGLPAVDYFLGDVHLDGEQGQLTQAEFTEELLVLPHSHFCYVPLQEVPLPTKPAYLRNGYVTFGSFNNFAKVTDDVLKVWAQILRHVSHAHLLLKASVFDGGETEAYTRNRLAAAGLPMDRVECRGISQDYLSEYGDMDIALDTFPYPGGGTSCDALYMGRPLITLAGKRHGERFGYSLLMNMGLEELITYSPQEYIECAVTLARDTELLQGLQVNLRRIMQKSPLMGSSAYMKSLEDGYQYISKGYSEGEKL